MFSYPITNNETVAAVVLKECVCIAKSHIEYDILIFAVHVASIFPLGSMWVGPT